MRRFDPTMIRIGTPVSARQWEGMRQTVLDCLSTPGALIPAALANAIINTGDTRTFNFYIAPSLRCSRRVLYFDVVSDGSEAIEFEVNVDGVPVGSSLAPVPGAIVYPPQAFEFDVTPSETPAPTAIEVTHLGDQGADPIIVRTIALVEIPDPPATILTRLGLGGLTGVGPSDPIVFRDGESVKALWKAYHALDVRRAGHFHLPIMLEVPATFTSHGSLISSPPHVLAGLLDVGATTGTLEVWVLARASASTFTVRAWSEATGGAGYVESDAWSSTGSAYVWKSVSLAFDCEDLTTDDGRRSSRWEGLSIDAFRVSAPGPTFEVAAVSLIRPRISGQQL